jgi:hypothetical protein
MIATIGNNTINNLKPGSVLAVTGAESAMDAQQEVEDFLELNKRQDLDYFLISKNYFLVYAKPGESLQGAA